MSRSTSYIGPIAFEGLEDLEEDLLAEDSSPLAAPAKASDSEEPGPSTSGIMAPYAAVGGRLLDPVEAFAPEDISFDEDTEVGTHGEPAGDVDAHLTGEMIPLPEGALTPDDDTAPEPAFPGLTTSDLVVASSKPRSLQSTLPSPPRDPSSVDRSTVARAVAAAEARRVEIAPRIDVDDLSATQLRGPWVSVATLTLVGAALLAWLIFG
ncbi:MAG: hypothetical protein AAFU79_01755 [Myxococcota bacterium]